MVKLDNSVCQLGSANLLSAMPVFLRDSMYEKWAVARLHRPSKACLTNRFLSWHKSRALSSSILDGAAPIVAELAIFSPEKCIVSETNIQIN